MKNVFVSSLVVILFLGSTSAWSLGFKLHKLLKFDSSTAQIQFKDHQVQNLFEHLKQIQVAKSPLKNISIKCMGSVIQLKADLDKEKSRVKYTFLKSKVFSRDLAAVKKEPQLKLKRELVENNEKVNMKEFILSEGSSHNDFIHAELENADRLNLSLNQCCSDELSCLAYLKQRFQN